MVKTNKQKIECKAIVLVEDQNERLVAVLTKSFWRHISAQANSELEAGEKVKEMLRLHNALAGKDVKFIGKIEDRVYGIIYIYKVLDVDVEALSRKKIVIIALGFGISDADLKRKITTFFLGNQAEELDQANKD